MTTPNVLIATPTGGSVKTEYMKSVLAMTDFCRSRGIPTAFTTEEGSDVRFQRNVLATRFLDEKQFTHLLFVDSDMIFTPDVCTRLLERNHAVIGTIYPRKSVSFPQIKQAMDKGIGFDDAIMFGFDWLSFISQSKKQIEIVDNVVEVERLGFGIVLIKRHVLQKMVDDEIARPIANLSETRPTCYNFFSTRPQAAVSDGDVAEDLSFCDRWRLDCGGRIYALVNAPVLHVAELALGGEFMNYLRVIKALQTAGRL